MAVRVNGVKTISELASASTINDSDLLVLETSGGTKKVAGSVLKNYVFTTVDKNELVSLVIAQIPMAEGVSF